MYTNTYRSAAYGYFSYILRSTWYVVYRLQNVIIFFASSLFRAASMLSHSLFFFFVISFMYKIYWQMFVAAKLGAQAAPTCLPRVGVSRLRRFLERRVEECYRRNVARIVPLLQQEMSKAEGRLLSTEQEVFDFVPVIPLYILLVAPATLKSIALDCFFLYLREHEVLVRRIGRPAPTAGKQWRRWCTGRAFFCVEISWRFFVVRFVQWVRLLFARWC